MNKQDLLNEIQAAGRCYQCPHNIGDSDLRDCDMPNCMSVGMGSVIDAINKHIPENSVVVPDAYQQGVADTLCYILDNGEAIPEEELQRIGAKVIAAQEKKK